MIFYQFALIDFLNLGVKGLNPGQTNATCCVRLATALRESFTKVKIESNIICATSCNTLHDLVTKYCIRSAKASPTNKNTFELH